MFLPYLTPVQIRSEDQRIVPQDLRDLGHAIAGFARNSGMEQDQSAVTAINPQFVNNVQGAIWRNFMTKSYRYIIVLSGE